MKLDRLLLITLALVFVPATMALAQAGKIAGQVVDGETGNPLPGVNVIIEGTTQGSVTNSEGYYTILNVSPGTYSVRASFVGYTPKVVTDVRVNNNLTSEVNFELTTAAVGLDEVVVTAQRPVVRPDVSASMANITSEQMASLPVVSVADVISLQAGFEPGLTIRGSGGSQVSFVVDGFSYANPRSNNPMLGISYTSIERVQVQTGGFNAEYGNVRSGLISVVTVDPPKDNYTVDVITRYSAPSHKYFGKQPDHPDAYFVRPYQDTTPIDTDGDGTIDCQKGVAYCGTSAWPVYIQDQYPTFAGWTDYAAGTGFSPAQMYEAYKWLIRKDFEATEPEYVVDGTIAGPVPFISPFLGDLRFSASFRQTEEPLAFTQARGPYRSRTFQGKLVSNIAPSMKLTFSGLYGAQRGHVTNGEGYAGIFTGETPQYPWDGRGYLFLTGLGTEPVFENWWYSPTDIERSIFGMEFTHTLGAQTFYEVKLQRTANHTITGAGEPRLGGITGASTIVACVTPDAETVDAQQNGQCADGAIPLTQAPFGYKQSYENAVVPTAYGSLGAHGGAARDSSNVARWIGSLDVTSQLNRFMQLQAGAEFIYSDYFVKHGRYDPANPHHANPKFQWSRSPMQGALYVQTKLEFEGMIANLGVRADYFYPGGLWYDYTAYDQALAASVGVNRIDEALEMEPTEHQFALSPRVGVSFPITVKSKLYFNYGHFRQMTDPRDLFLVKGDNSGAVVRMGNPNMPMPKTVAYELGYEHNIANAYLLRIAGFYRSLSNQPRSVTYISLDDAVNYEHMQPLNYGDYRGVEVTLRKNRGTWLRGFINYTYLARSSGNFGYGTINQNRVEFLQYLRSSTDHYQYKPIPEPFARFNIELRTPNEFGPEIAGRHLLGNWAVNFLGEWRAGAPSTWNGQTLAINSPGSDPDIAYNTSFKDYYMLDMRVTKNFNASFGNLQLFVDFKNVLNLRQMYWLNGAIFQGPNDQLDYMRSLHLPKDVFGPPETASAGYVWVPGDDQPGDYRKPGVAYDPIYAVADVAQVETPIPNVLYWDQTTGKYKVYSGGSWAAADQSRLNHVLETKAYIDMPNESYLTFLNPRNIFFGLRISF